jgi:methyl-accepting chemotaxis protein
MTEMRASIILTLKDQLSAKAAALAGVFKPLEGGIKDAIDKIKGLQDRSAEASKAVAEIGAAADKVAQDVGKIAAAYDRAVDAVKRLRLESCPPCPRCPGIPRTRAPSSI